MRNTRNILLLIPAVCLALLALVLPPLWRGLAQKQFEETVSQAGGYVGYDCGFQHAGLKRWLFDKIGRHLVGDICVVNLQRQHDPEIVNRLLEKCREVPRLWNLSLDGTVLDAAAIEKIAAIQPLGFLDLAGARVSQLRPLARLPNLMNLSLKGGPRLRPRQSTYWRCSLSCRLSIWSNRTLPAVRWPGSRNSRI